MEPRRAVPSGAGGAVLLAAYFACLPLLDVGVALPGLAWKRLVLSDVAFAALLAWAARAPGERLLPCRRGLLCAAAMPVLAILVASLANRSLDTGLPTLLRTAYSLSVLALLAHLRLTQRDLLLAARSWTATAIAVSAFGVGALAWFVVVGPSAGSVEHAYVGVSDNLGGVARVGGVMSTNALALFLHVSVAFSVFLGMRGGTKRARRLGWIAFTVQLAAATLTLSRGLVGLLVSLSLIGFVFRGEALWRFRHWLAGATAAVAVAATALTILPGSIVFDGLPRGPSLRNECFVLYRGALRMWRESPVVGVGPGSFGLRLAQFTTEAEREEARPAIAPEVAYDPHSFWFGALAEGGLLLGLSWATLFGGLLQQLSATRRASRLSALTLLTTVGLVVNGLHVDLGSLKFLWAAIGIGLAAGAVKASDEVAATASPL